jgi:hypothetical protein
MAVSDSYEEIAQRFAAVALRYCAIVDAAENYNKTEFLLQIYRALPDIIAEAVRLPEIEFDEGDEDDGLGPGAAAKDEPAKKDSGEWARLFESLKEKLGDANLYWHIFNPTKIEEPIYGSLADDIADIYGDLRKGLVLTKQGGKMAEEAIWEWRFGFYSHWGHHALSALRTLHEVLNDRLVGLEG